MYHLLQFFYTALHILVSNCDEMDDHSLEKCIDLLINKGVPLDMQDTRGNTALHLAVWGGHEAVVQARGVIHLTT